MRLNINIRVLPGILVLMLFSLFSCTQDGSSIFYSLEIEQKTPDNSLPNDITVTSIIKNGSDYWIAAGAVFKRALTATDWDRVAPPAGYTSCNAMVKTSTRIFAVFFNQAGTIRLFSRPLVGGYWTAINDTSGSLTFNGNDAQNIRVANDQVFVSLSNNKLYYSTDGTGANFEDTTITTSGTTFDVAYGDITTAIVGSEFWVATNSAVQYADPTAPNTWTAVTLPTGAANFRAIYFSSTFPTAAPVNHIYVATEDGYVYATTDGSTWITSAQKKINLQSSAADKIVQLLRISEITRAGTPVLLFASDYTYWETQDPTTDGFTLNTPAVTANANYKNTQLYLRDSTILQLFTDPVTNDLFACTSGNGLWRNKTSGEWTWE